MSSILSGTRASRTVMSILGLTLLAAGAVNAAESKFTLTGAEETPSVTTSASGSGAITIASDKSVSGTVTTKDIVGTAAHIHLAAAGANGPAVVSLNKTSDNVWSVPAGTKLNDEQYASYQAGNLYVNVHSAENKKGEIRGQIKP